MTTDIDIPAGAPVWMDLVTSEVDRGATFYCELFGWTINDTPPEFGGYKYFEKDGKAVGGCMRNDAEWGMPNTWSIFLRTDDATTTETLAKEHGGEVLMPTMKVQENGSFCIVRDPSGAVISAWQPGTETGFGVMWEPFAPAHFELQTNKYDAAVQFYTDVFGWNPHILADEAGFRYPGVGPAESPQAGVMDAAAYLPEGVPSHWSAYIAVTDVDATVTKALQLGGAVVEEATDTPYGRLATISDPTGAVIKLQG